MAIRVFWAHTIPSQTKSITPETTLANSVCHSELSFSMARPQMVVLFTEDASAYF